MSEHDTTNDTARSEQTAADAPRWEKYGGTMRAEWRGLALKASGSLATLPWWSVHRNGWEIASGYPKTAEQAMRDAEDAAERYLRERDARSEHPVVTIEQPSQTTITVPAGVRFTITFHGDSDDEAQDDTRAAVFYGGSDDAPRSASDSSDEEQQA